MKMKKCKKKKKNNKNKKERYLNGHKMLTRLFFETFLKF